VHEPPLSIVWPCALDVSAYLALGQQVEVDEHALALPARVRPTDA
jgi:hypothetical protein